MKNGKLPTKKQKLIIASKKLNPADWLVVKSLINELHIVHRHTDKLRVIEL